MTFSDDELNRIQAAVEEVLRIVHGDPITNESIADVARMVAERCGVVVIVVPERWVGELDRLQPCVAEPTRGMVAVDPVLVEAVRKARAAVVAAYDDNDPGAIGLLAIAREQAVEALADAAIEAVQP